MQGIIIGFILGIGAVLALQMIGFILNERRLHYYHKNMLAPPSPLVKRIRKRLDRKAKKRGRK